MALIKCPECGKQISTRAESCPNCGYPISEDELVEALEDVEEGITSTLVDKAREFVEEEEYEEALKYFKIAADAEDVDAMYEIWLLRSKHKYDGLTNEEASDYLIKSAEGGNEDAASTLGSILLRDEHKPLEALKILEKAPNSKDAWFDKAVIYDDALKKTNEALECYKKSAALGEVDALFNIATIYYNGRHDLKKNYKEAKKYFELAAEHNDSEAMNILGNIYNLGQGVTKDSKIAKKYYEKAKALGNKNAQKHLDNDFGPFKYVILKKGFNFKKFIDTSYEYMRVTDAKYKYNFSKDIYLPEDFRKEKFAINRFWSGFCFVYYEVNVENNKLRFTKALEELFLKNYKNLSEWVSKPLYPHTVDFQGLETFAKDAKYVIEATYKGLTSKTKK